MSCTDAATDAYGRHFRWNAQSCMPFQRYAKWKEYSGGVPGTQGAGGLKVEREWPDHKLVRAPRWCSVDLRDGNQSLTKPMTVDQKLSYFRALVAMGFKEIEIGFPSASQTEFEFCRNLIEERRIPEDVWVSVLVPAIDSLIHRTIESVQGANRVILHLYVPTSELQRRVALKQSTEETVRLAVHGTSLLRSLADSQLRPKGTLVMFEFSPEGFSTTELEFAFQISSSVMEAWGATRACPMILNLPSSVDASPSNFYADQIEWIHKKMKQQRACGGDGREGTSMRDRCHISVHTHNDRGTAVACAESALMAGADRVEGCLFGNGERAGNLCLVTLAINLLQNGVDPELDLRDLPSLVRMYEANTDMAVPARHPWAGALAYAAFSGTHQDSIKKGLDMLAKRAAGHGEKMRQARWECPYLLVDPLDLGRGWDDIIRINSQSGKGGVAYLMEQHLGLVLPRGLQTDFGWHVKKACTSVSGELTIQELERLFWDTYTEREPIAVKHWYVVPHAIAEVTGSAVGCDGYQKRETSDEADVPTVGSPCVTSSPSLCEPLTPRTLEVDVLLGSRAVSLSCDMRKGPLNAFVNSLNELADGTAEDVPIICLQRSSIEIKSYLEQSLRKGSDSAAACFVEVDVTGEVGGRQKTHTVWGAARHRDVLGAGLLGICSALNRLEVGQGS